MSLSYDEYIWSPLSPVPFKRARIIDDGSRQLTDEELSLLHAEYSRLFDGCNTVFWYFKHWNRGYNLIAQCPGCLMGFIVTQRGGRPRHEPFREKLSGGCCMWPDMRPLYLGDWSS